MSEVIVLNFYHLPSDAFDWFYLMPKDLSTLKEMERTLKKIIPGNYIFIQWCVSDDANFFVAVDDSFELLRLMEYT
jgi:hypothetical protein